MSNEYFSRVTIHDLPSEITINVTKPNPSLIHLAFYLGTALLVLGIIFIIFGPEYVYVDWSRGISFIQFFQLYPGPIASVGGVVVAVCMSLESGMNSSYTRKVNDEINTKIDIPPEAVPAGFILQIVQKSDLVWNVDLARKSDDVPQEQGETLYSRDNPPPKKEEKQSAEYVEERGDFERF